ncbi:hypothetical protein GQ600_255 [Phytophthora cactorum]|nr:hypothetical protein GQ600_255 [Phytophthora cactorum]
MNEEDEFGMNKTTRTLTDGARKQERREIRAAVTSDDKRAVPLWMTPCLHQGADRYRLHRQRFLVTEEHPNSVLFRKTVTQESHGPRHGQLPRSSMLCTRWCVSVQAAGSGYCTLVSDENKLLGGMVSAGKNTLWAGQDHNQPQNMR